MDYAEELYQRLIEPIEQRMMGTVLRIVRDPDDAADVFQEVLAVIWRKLARIDRHPNPHAYILRICITRSYDALRSRSRRRRREMPLEESKAEAFSVSSEEAAGGGESVERVRELVGLLPRRQGQAVLLRVMDGSSYARIGSILGCSEATARSHFSKGIARLRKRLVELNIVQRKGTDYELA